MIDLDDVRKKMNESIGVDCADIPTARTVLAMCYWIDRAAARMRELLPDTFGDLIAELAPAPTMGGDLWPGEETGDK